MLICLVASVALAFEIRPPTKPSGSYSGLQHLQRIAQDAPCLLEAAHCLGKKELSHLDALYAQIVESSHYLSLLEPAAPSVLRFALEVSFIAHSGQKRRSGEPYIIHPCSHSRGSSATESSAQ